MFYVIYRNIYTYILTNSPSMFTYFFPFNNEFILNNLIYRIFKDNLKQYNLIYDVFDTTYGVSQINSNFCFSFGNLIF